MSARRTGAQSSERDREIERVKDALRRLVVRFDADFPTARGDCCRSCRYGDALHAPAEKIQRVRAWLAVLLRKRGHPEDLQLARAIELDSLP